MIKERENSVKESFFDRVYGHVDDRLIEAYIAEYTEIMDTQELWSDFTDTLEVVEDFKRFVSFAVEFNE